MSKWNRKMENPPLPPQMRKNTKLMERSHIIKAYKDFFGLTEEEEIFEENLVTIDFVESVFKSYAKTCATTSTTRPTKKWTWDEKNAIQERGKKRKFYPDCNRGEAWAEGYFTGHKEGAISNNRQRGEELKLPKVDPDRVKQLNEGVRPKS